MLIRSKSSLTAAASFAASCALLAASSGASFGDTYSATMPPGEAPGSGWVNEVKVLPDKAPDCTSLKSIVDTVTRGCTTNDEKAVAIYNFMMLSHYHRNYPNESGGLPSIKEINCYGWSLCGGLHTEESALWRAAGWNWRYVGWSGHTTVEAEYDGRWHYLDVFLHFYAWEPDGKGGKTIASEDDLTKNSGTLINAAFELKPDGAVYAKDDEYEMKGDHANWEAPAFLSCGDTIKEVTDGLKTHHRNGSPEGWAGIIHANGKYNTDLALAPGVSLTDTWEPKPHAFYWNGQTKAVPGHTCSNYKDTRNSPGYGLVLEPYCYNEPKGMKNARSYGNGTLEFAPDFSNDAFLKAFTSIDNAKYENNSLVPVDSSKPGSVVLELTSPYILTEATGEATGADSIEVSTDGGKTYKPADIKNFSQALQIKGIGNTEAFVKVNFKQPLTALKIEATVQNNPGSLPYLSPGKNVVSVSVADPAALGNNKLVVTYAYQLGSRTMSFDELCQKGKHIAIGSGSAASWDPTITYVQKTYTAKDLEHPVTFEVDCPTPKGKYPVYPRMVFLRREVVANGSSPLPLPEGAVEAKPASADELLTLPDPFLIGTQAAAAQTAGIE